MLHREESSARVKQLLKSSSRLARFRAASKLPTHKSGDGRNLCVRLVLLTFGATQHLNAGCTARRTYQREELFMRLSVAERAVPADAQRFHNPAPSISTAAITDISAPQFDLRPALAAKRAIDIIGSAGLLIVTSPLLIGTALAIKATSAGPVLFRQQRYGLNNERFTIFKFRTMFANDTDSSGVNQTRAGDPRVTKLGSFLRRTNIDELPQLINVLRGDMSLVGPRPHVPGMLAGGMLYEVLVPSYFTRHRVRPGMTGLAQINELRGRTREAKFARARIAYDLAYIDHWSLLLDLRILWTTLKTELLRGTGN
jgi:lipopolysaccharide/colanic/teichoic acid biosynthesis glycosyltransferase